jgi:hypothetical protein
MFSHTFRIISALLVLSSVAAVYAVAADQPPASKDSKNAVQAEPAKEPDKKPVPAQASPAGVVVFIDPATGKIRQPDASEIGGLTAPAGSVMPKAPEPPTLIQGPGGAVGARLGEDSLTYMVVTKVPDGKLAMDCVTGDKAATARVTSGQASPAKEISKGHANAQAQDTHDVKVPR